MWLANLEDGSTVAETKQYWTDFKKETRMTGLVLTHPRIPKIFISLSNYDKYYFAREAISTIGGGSSESRILADIIGGHDEALGIGIEVRMEASGSVKIKSYPIAKFKYSPSILYNGKKNGKADFAISGDVKPEMSKES